MPIDYSYKQNAGPKKGPASLLVWISEKFDLLHCGTGRQIKKQKVEYQTICPISAPNKHAFFTEKRFSGYFDDHITASLQTD
jgi:hypothetical protein